MDFLRSTQNLKKSSSCFGHVLSKCTKHEEDWANFCVLLKKSELYYDPQSVGISMQSPRSSTTSRILTLLEMLLLYVNVFNENVTKNASFFSFSFSLQLGSYAQHRSTIYFWFSTVSWILLFTVVSTRNSNSSFFNIKKKTNKTTAVPNKINKFLAEMRSLNSETLPGWLGSFKPTLITIQVSLYKIKIFSSLI